MKKFLALVMCALMVAAAVSSVSAVDYIVNKDFEANAEGAYQKENNQLTVSPKDYKIEIAKVGDTKALKFDRQNYKDGGASDSFAHIMNDGPANNGVASKYVISYDFMLEKSDGVKNADGTWASNSSWQAAMIRMTPASSTSTQFQHTAMLYGNELWIATLNGNPDYENGKAAATLEKGVWYNLAVVVNMEGKSFSVYLNGDTIVENQAWSVADTSATPAEVSYIRIGWTGSGTHTYNGVAYVDNIKAYNADKPENATGKVYGAAAETTAPETTAPAETTDPAPATADVAVILAAAAAVAASGVIVFKKRK